ncbi:putative toxin biosynthesis protein [Aspergillus steynii IBT 23096]|uniref:Putative toxin biosynthesis protein n=1 Tax=Aspergillus steynii IBT 23096 TaxID=1392250 RepID=A0A2I2GD76_9EURO|nr:putative toxin biosynthesis protein [Aspergillus steynii IBT 23096]PLB50777.1 putative toxin biosynthesis protein [Aspergillus steynii IBT 23096]
MSAFDVWRVPVAQWTLMQLVTAMAVGLTPSRSRLRPAVAAVVVALACGFQREITGGAIDVRVAGPMMASCWLNVLNKMDLLVLSRISYDGQVEWEKRAGVKATRSGSLVARILWALGTAFNYRRVNTPWQVRMLPRFGGQGMEDGPERGRFVLVGVGKVVLGVVLLALFTVDTTDPNLLPAIEALPRDESVLLPWVYAASMKRAVLQIAFTISFGICCRAFILAGYNIGAITAVGLGIHHPSAWPPIAGSLFEGWSLRRLWGYVHHFCLSKPARLEEANLLYRISWHQTLRPLLSANADMITSSILRIPRASRWAVYLRLVIAFMLSGLFHSGIDLTFGIAWEDSGALWFFTMQAVGILVESAFQHAFRRWVGALSPVVRRALGFLWVCVFLLWTAPVWMDPMVRSVYVDGTPVFSPFLMFRSWPV